MTIARKHTQESQRLGSLAELALMDTPPEERFDRIARLTAATLDVPIVLITFIDDERQYFKARVGTDLTEMPRDLSFCAHALVDAEAGVFSVPDARLDARFFDNPAVVGGPLVQFYAGRLLHAGDGLPVGTLCVFDRAPRVFDQEEMETFNDLGALVVDEIGRDAQQRREEAARKALDGLDHGVIMVEPDGRISQINPAAERLLGFSARELNEFGPNREWETYDDAWVLIPRERRSVLRAFFHGENIDGEVVGWQRKDGERIRLRLTCVADADGMGGLLLGFSDVTEQEQAFHELSQFQLLFQHADDIITVLEEDLSVRFSSPATERILGYPFGFRNPLGILAHVHPQDRPGAAVAIADLVDGRRGPEPFRMRVQTHTGGWRHMETVGVNLLAEPGVRGIVLTSRDITERQALIERLAHLAGHDPLTDLANRSVLEPQLGQALARAGRSGLHVGVCFIDLDDFKVVNDALGHAIGDGVLVEVADRICGIVRAGDTAIRMGGDEFVVILDPLTGVADAVDAGRRIRDTLVSPPLKRGDLVVGASVGVALSGADDTPEDLLRRADDALYRAKAREGSAVCADSDESPYVR